MDGGVDFLLLCNCFCTSLLHSFTVCVRVENATILWLTFNDLSAFDFACGDGDVLQNDVKMQPTNVSAMLKY